MVDPTTLTPPSPEAIAVLEKNGCMAADWNRVRLHPASNIQLIRNVEFEGEVSIGLIDEARFPGSRIINTLLADSSLGDGVRIRNVGSISGATIGSGAVIENTRRISYDLQPACGVGLRIGVLDETGSREVIIYPGLSAQAAMLMARARRSDAEKIYARTLDYIDRSHTQFPQGIGPDARILDCGTLHNVAVDAGVSIEGARMLREGSVVNNLKPAAAMARIGAGVDAEGFIIEDGIVEAGALLRNCYVGQGVRIEKGFTAHDSLFFANCSLENGEACALFAGPYTVSMHKGTLLIGCQTSFLNAGSSTNQSNHMYKLGPVHWGVLERGVKTSSGSYLMLGANIGAFSLLMGQHKTHPDSTEFPFSYLFGDPQGATVVVPAVMLRSCGLMRDEKKWPARDRREPLPPSLRHDRINFSILNPSTIDVMLKAIATIRPMLSRPADDDHYHRYKGMKLSRASLERAIKLYSLGILKYLSLRLPELTFPLPPADEEARELAATPWTDLAGQLVPRPTRDAAISAAGVEEAEEILSEAFRRYSELELEWIAAVFPTDRRPTPEEIRRGAEEFDRLVEQDRLTYRDSLSAEEAMLSLR